MAGKGERKKASGRRTFEESVDAVGDGAERFGKRVERDASRWARGPENWWYDTFGVAAPLVSGLIGLLVLAVVILFLDMVGAQAGLGFVVGVNQFLKTNLLLLFLLMLLFGYTTYFSRFYRNEFAWVMPVVTALSITISIWIIVSILVALAPYLGVPFFTDLASAFTRQVLLLVFFVAVVLGYLVLYAWFFYARAAQR